MDRRAIEQLLRANQGRFYVYLLSRPDGTPFYVGKGIGRRVFQHETEALGPNKSHKLNTIRQFEKSGYSIQYSIIAFFDGQTECHECEMAEIRRIGRYDLKTGPLTNLTDGGPILITQHGLPSAYLVDVASFERLLFRMNLLEGIARGEWAVEEGRTLTHLDAKAELSQCLK